MLAFIQEEEEGESLFVEELMALTVNFDMSCMVFLWKFLIDFFWERGTVRYVYLKRLNVDILKAAHITGFFSLKRLKIFFHILKGAITQL